MLTKTRTYENKFCLFIFIMKFALISISKKIKLNENCSIILLINLIPINFIRNWNTFICVHMFFYRPRCMEFLQRSSLQPLERIMPLAMEISAAIWHTTFREINASQYQGIQSIHPEIAQTSRHYCPTQIPFVSMEFLQFGPSLWKSVIYSYKYAY